ncbi:NTF2-like N-terminal transpeptidase domain-containing protein [Chloroflexota bacterium]
MSHNLRSRRLLRPIGGLKRISVVFLVMLVLVAACGPIAPAAAPVNEEALPTVVQLTLEEAEAVAATFFDSWVKRDYPAMYSLISFRSREAYPEEQFVDIYESVAQEMTLTNYDYDLRSSLRQGNTVSINYDMTFDTSFLGTLEDLGRTVRLVVTDEGWRVAWSPADIFAEMAGGGAIVMDRQLPIRANIYDREGQVLVNQSGIAIPVTVVQENIPRFDDCRVTLMRVLRLNWIRWLARSTLISTNWKPKNSSIIVMPALRNAPPGAMYLAVWLRM